MKKLVLFVALCVATIAVGYSQVPSKIDVKVQEIVKIYNNVKGVECMTVTKGSGLEMVKLMLNKQFGKDFMKGVTSVTVINYSSAPQDTCLALRREVESFGSLLQEFKFGDEKSLVELDYVRCYAAAGEDCVSDFLAAFEGSGMKVVFYMSGKIKVE